jgi:hypothetical protein
VLDRRWTGAGQALDRPWTGAGQVLDRRWTGRGQALDRPWTVVDSLQTVVYEGRVQMDGD